MSRERRILLVMMCVVALFISVVGSALAQSAKPGWIEGKVVDAQTGEGLPMVTVLLSGTPMGNATELDGHYAILNVPAGKYEVVFSMIGYAKVTVTEVTVNPEKATVLKAALSSEAIQGKEVVVTAKRIESSVAGLLATQRTAATVSDGLAAEQISKSPDSDAADALKRVTGLSVVGGKYVYVRGLGERYSNTQLNGAPLASPEPNKRAVPLDIIPANLLEKIVVTKTFSPDQPGDFSGGSVQITAKEFPENKTFEFGLSSGLNSQTTLKDFQVYDGGDLDWLAIDDGTRDIPGTVEELTDGQKIKAKGRFGGPGFSRDTLAIIGKSFRNGWSSRRITAPVNQGYNLSIGDQINRSSIPIGYLASLTYNNSYSSRQEEIYIYSTSQDENGQVELNRMNHFYDVRPSTFEVLWGGVLNVSARPSPNNKISLKTIYNRSAEDRVRTYSAFVRDYCTSELDTMKSTQLRYRQRSLLHSQLAGEHHLPGLIDSDVNWNITLSQATNDEPDTREILYFKGEEDSLWEWMDEPRSGSLFFAYLQDEELSGAVNWEIPFKWQGMPAKLKFGSFLSSMDRTYDLRRLQFGIGTSKFDESLRQLPPESIYQADHFGDTGFLPDEKTNNVDNYDGEQHVFSTFGMIDAPLGARLRVITGLRVEDWDQSVVSYDIFDPDKTPIPSELDYTDILPSANVVYKFTEKMNMRMAVSQTITRPFLRELAPVEYTDFMDGIAERGNPNLKRTLVQNYDLRWEYYRTPGEFVALSLGYKNFQDPIEKLILAGANTTQVPANTKGAHNMAAEFEVRTGLDALGGFWENFNVAGNISFIDSEVEIGDSVTVLLVSPGQTSPSSVSTMQTSSKRALEGQSPYVANIILGCQHPRLNTELSLFYNVFGRRISSVGSSSLPDIYEEARHDLDVTLSQPFGNWKAKVKVGNLLGSKYEFTQGGLIQYQYKTGRTISLGVSYKI